MKSLGPASTNSLPIKSRHCSYSETGRGSLKLLLLSLLVSAGCASDEPIVEADAPDGGLAVPVSCTPPALLKLDDIPDLPSLNDNDPDTVAIFEVDGHNLIGKHVTDRAAAEGGLRLWQEFTLRIPENQLQDLVQFDIYEQNDPIAYFNRNGDVMTERAGLKIGFSTKTFTQNDPDPCAPLVPRRGSFDWSLVHEFGHLRGWLDGTWPEFLTTFPNVEGLGEGYPEDGSPVLDRDFVTSYAERDDGDEDYAETFTTFVMLDGSEIPPAVEGEPLAATKVRWMSELPGMAELRAAIRISESDARAASVEALPRLLDVHPDIAGPAPAAIVVPSWMQGTWHSGSASDGWVVVATSDDITSSLFEDGAESGRVSIKDLIAADGIRRWRDVEGQSPEGDPGYGYQARLRAGGTITDTYQLIDGQMLFVGINRWEGRLDKID